ncbi:MAG: lytic transglycosylase, partial [Lysobacteraceae bacterium]
LVPKASASQAGDIAENITENAVVAFEAERSPRVKASASRYKAKAGAPSTKRIARNTSSKRKKR